MWENPASDVFLVLNGFMLSGWVETRPNRAHFQALPIPDSTHYHHHHHHLRPLPGADDEPSRAENADIREWVKLCGQGSYLGNMDHYGRLRKGGMMTGFSGMHNQTAASWNRVSLIAPPEWVSMMRADAAALNGGCWFQRTEQLFCFVDFCILIIWAGHREAGFYYLFVSDLFV